jgi:hypothetical protein
MNHTGEFKALCSGYGLTEARLGDCAVDLQRVALKDVLRAAAWAYNVHHGQIDKFVGEVREIYCKIFAR